MPALDLTETQKATFDRLQKLLAPVARKHTRICQRNASDRANDAAELVCEYAAELFNNPARLQEMAAAGTGLVQKDFARWVDDAAPVGSEESTWSPYSWVRMKLREALPKDPEIRRREGRLPMYELVAAGPSAETGPARAVLELLPLLPALPSKLRPQREGQRAPIVSEEHLVAFAKKALTLARAGLSIGDLAYLAYEKLQPHPDFHPLGRKASLEALEEGGDGEEAPRRPVQASSGRRPDRDGRQQHWEAVVDLHASEFVKSVPGVTLAAVTASLPKAARSLVPSGPYELLLRDPDAAEGLLSTRDAALEAGMGKTQVARRRNEFASLFERFCKRAQLDRWQIRDLKLAVLDILRVGAFSPLQEEAS